MALVDCSKHAFRGAELVSPKLQNMIHNDDGYSGKVYEVSIKFEDLEFPRFITADELKEMGLEKKLSNGIIEFDNERHAEEVIGLFVPVCLVCFQEFVKKHSLF